MQVVFDKGTYDAISLGENVTKNQRKYHATIGKLLKPGEGYFLITSCNFTRDELVLHFSGSSFLLHPLKNALSLSHAPLKEMRLVAQVKYPTFSFGGREGSKVTTIAFQHK